MEDLFENTGLETQEPNPPETENQNSIETQEPMQTEIETPDQDTTLTTETQSEEPEQEVEQVETETKGVDPIFELNIKGKIEKYDISDPTQREKLIQYFQKGRHYEQEMERLKKEYSTNSEAVERIKLAIANKYAYDLVKGNVPNKYPIEEDFIGTTDSVEGDREAYRQALQNWHQIEEMKKQWSIMFDNTNRKYEEQLETFRTKHPEIPDVEEWIKEALRPYYEAVLSMGTKPFPDDTFEMIYYWQNRNKIEQKIREDERKKLAKKVTVPKTPQAPNQIKVNTEQKTQFDRDLEEAFGI